MIELPDEAVPNGVTPRLIDFGFVQESVGGASTRIDRPGSRIEAEVRFAPLTAELARVVERRLVRAVSEGIRIEMPLSGVDQTGAGLEVVVDGADSAGRTLKLRGITPQFTFKEGFWLTHVAADGVHRLHMVASMVEAGADGKAVLSLDPPLRAFPADGDAVLVARPLIEGFVSGAPSWEISPDQLVRGLGFVLREGA